jgi:hypothetical protein
MANNWMNQAMSPSKAAFAKWYADKQKGLKNEISTLHKQYVGMGQGSIVKGLNNMLGTLPTSESINAAYSQARAGLGNLLSEYNTAQGGADVSGIVGAMGAGIGADKGVTSDAATAAGTLSGVGAWGGNVADKALLLGTGAKLAGDAVTDVRSAADQRMQIMNNLFTAQANQQDKKNTIAAQIAQLRDKQASSKVDPLDLATMFMKFNLNKIAYNKALKGGSSKSSKKTTTVTTPTTTSTDAWK